MGYPGQLLDQGWAPLSLELQLVDLWVRQSQEPEKLGLLMANLEQRLAQQWSVTQSRGLLMENREQLLVQELALL